MSLETWLAERLVRRHSTNQHEIELLWAGCDRHLKSARSAAVESDWRLAMAYQATLHLAAAALGACGYRARAVGHHVHLIQSLALTMCLEPRLIITLEHFRDARHSVMYGGSREISECEAEEMIEIAIELRQRFLVWLQANHSGLLPC